MNIKAKLSRRRALPVVALGVSLAVGGGFAIDAASSAKTVNTQQTAQTVQHEVSRNWAGYVVQNQSGQPYSAVSGSWNVPSVSSTTRYGSTADWIGIGGSTKNSKALEQTGTSSDVVNGKARYYAWYEIVPAAESKFKLAVHPGDHMYARVTVHGKTVTMSLSDQTTGHSVSKTEHPRQTDTSSAEWIAEAPSIQLPGGGDQVLPLADFGKVKFASAYATAGGRKGTISASGSTDKEVQLSSGGKITLPGARADSGTLAGVTITLPSSGSATPSNLSHRGTSFAVTYNSNSDKTRSSSRGGVTPGWPPFGSGLGGGL